MTASNVAMIDDFNPRSHEGSDDKRFYKKEFQHISIHAPTRGATCFAYCIIHSRYISIHAPTRGATRNTTPAKKPIAISIHAPTRGATGVYEHENKYPIKISIHAPTRGATIQIPVFRQSELISIHAPTRGATVLTSGGTW